MDEQNISLQTIDDIPSEIDEVNVLDIQPNQKQIDHYNNFIKPKLYQLSILISQNTPEVEIFEFLKLNDKSFYAFKRWFPELKNAVNHGKLSVVELAEKSLYASMVGMQYTEKEVIDTLVPDENTGELILANRKQRTTEKFVPPNMRAIELVLTNKAAAEWQKQVEASNIHDNTVYKIEVTPEERQAMIAKIGGLSIKATQDIVPKQIQEAEIING